MPIGSLVAGPKSERISQRNFWQLPAEQLPAFALGPSAKTLRKFEGRLARRRSVARSCSRSSLRKQLTKQPSILTNAGARHSPQNENAETEQAFVAEFLFVQWGLPSGP